MASIAMASVAWYLSIKKHQNEGEWSAFWLSQSDLIVL